MASKLMIGFLVLIIALVMYVEAQPTEYHVERSIAINAPTDTVFSYVNDLHQWERWAPSSKLDPNVRFAYDGPVAGVGSSFSWQGNRRIGTGKGTITESNPNALVRVKFEYMAPFTVTNTTDFLFKSDGPTTTVVWSTTGRHTFVSKFFSLFFSIDQKIGSEFEKGLTALKDLSESSLNENSHTM